MKFTIITLSGLSAYELVFDELLKLSLNEFIISINISKSALNPNVGLKFMNLNETIPVELWKFINLKSIKNDYNKIFDLEQKLHDLGISFDTGFGDGRDWFLDYSFLYDKNYDTQLIKLINLKKLTACVI